MSRKIYFVLFAALLTLALAWGASVVSAQGPTVGSKSPAAFADVITVNTTADENGAGASCSLREAVKTANDNVDFGGCTRVSQPGSFEKIIVPAGTYTLTSELLITASILVDGAGSSTTIVKNGSPSQARIFHVQAGTVTIQDLTIRDGDPIAAGGGGLRSEPGTIVTLDNVTVTLNTADGDGGGILNRGTMTCNNCSVTNNITTINSNGGGGIFSDDNTLLTLNSSTVLTNTAGGISQARGGGIYSGVGATLVLSNTTVSANNANPPGALAAFALGGGIASEGVMTVTLSTISNNVSKVVQQHSGARGGGVECITVGADALIDRSLIIGNSAVLTNSLDFQPQGGGIDSFCDLTIRNSIISNNSTDSQGSGGGLRLAGPTLIVNSTINGNNVTSRASSGGLGGGILTEAQVMLVNTTVSENDAEGDGGGIYVLTSVTKLSNATIKENTSNTDNLNGGEGGGIYIFPLNAVVNISNTVIAGNLETGAGTHDDCDGTIFSVGYNLVQNTSGCVVTGPGTDQLGVSALLNALANNGGFNAGANGGTTVFTHAPQANSPLINAGNPAGCRDQLGALLTTDGRGFARPFGRCDIGAFEVPGKMFLPLIFR